MTTTPDVLGYREWEAEGRERYFVVSALATARDVDRVKRDFKPLNPAWCGRIWKSLFSGLKRAFDTGWPHEAICQKFTNPAIRDPSVHVRADSMRKALDWPDDQIVYLVNDSMQVYECRFGDFVRHYRGNYLDLSQRYAICHPDDRRVMSFGAMGPVFLQAGPAVVSSHGGRTAVNLLLLPGMDGTGVLFEPLLRVLPSWLRPIVVQYPCAEPLGYAELLPIVEAAAPRGNDFVILGESFSGPLALMLAARKPPGLRGVILSASFIRNPLPPLEGLAPLVHPLVFRLAPVALAMRVLLGPYHAPALCRMLTAALASVEPVVLAARAQAILAVDVTADLQRCHVPILYLQARHDRVVRPSSFALIRRRRPHTEMTKLAGPHFLLQANPEDAATVIASFAVRRDRSNGSEPCLS